MSTMELDHNLISDFVSMLPPVLLILVTCTTIFYRLRARWPLKVNCWFCNVNTKIWKQNLNWWLCPSCEQYNGFSKDGDYTYDIPEQYATVKNCIRYCSFPQSDTSNILKNNLCADCNKWESLKLLELSKFEPRNENLHNVELKEFKNCLEKRYPLCNNCKSMVQDVLSNQALWLTRYKMLFFKQKPVRAVINNARKSETIFRIISTILDSITMYNRDFIWLPIGGLFFHLCACWASSMKKRNSDILLIFLWFCTIILVSINNFTIFQNVLLTIECISQYHMIIICTSIIALMNVKPNSDKSTLTKLVVFKRIKLRTRGVASESTYNDQNKNKNSLNETNDNHESSVYTANELPFSELTSYSVIARQTLSMNTVNNSNNNSISTVSLNRNSSSDYCLNDSLSILSALSLNEKSPEHNGRTSHIFERKIYNTTNSELFRRSNNILSRKYILAPPKLKSVTQTSWVAGGYWQEAMNASTLSRSSSQSSGFGSVGSNFAPSREPSVHDFDRCSIMSDATRSCHTPRPNITNSVRSLCNSPVSYTQSQSTFSDVATRNNPQQFLPSFVQTYNTIAAEQHLQDYVRPNMSQKNSIPIFPGHTTIVTSPTWLSALLCGSLILNMIVLCTTLLH